MAEVDDLIVKIGADVSELTKAMKKVDKKTEKTTKKINKEFAGTKKGFSIATKGALVFAAALTATAFAMKAFSALSEKISGAQGLARMADRLGVARSAFSELTVVAKKFGVEAEDVMDSVKDLNERIADAVTGTATYEDALKAVGLASKDLANLTPIAQFEAFATAIQKVNNVGKQNFIVAELMGDAGFRMMTIFREAGGNLKEFRKQVRDSGQAMSDFDFKSAEKAAKAILEMETAMAKMGTTLAVVAAPLLTNFAENVTGITNSLIGFTKSQGKATETLRAHLKSINAQITANQALKKSNEEISGEGDGGEFVDFGGSGGSGNEEQRVRAEQEELFKLRIKIGKELQEKLAEMRGEEEEKIANIKMAAKNKEIEEEKISQEKQLQKKLELLKFEKKFMDDINNVDAKALERNKLIWKSGWEGKRQIVSGVLGQLTSLMGSENRKQFEIGKAAAIAQVAIDTPAAAMSAYKSLAGIPYVGPYLGAAAAAAAVLAGKNNLDSIKSTQFAGGGSPPTPPGDPGGGGASAAGAPGGGEEITQNITNVDVTLLGDNFSQQSVRNTFNALQEASDDNVNFRVT